MARRMSIGVLAVGLCVVVAQPLPAVGQTSGQEVKQKTVEAAAALKDYAVDRKDDAVAYAKKLVDDLDAGIHELEAKLSAAKGDAKEKGQRQLTDLKAKRDKAAQQLTELKNESGNAWEHVKHGFLDAYRDLRESYDKAADEFRK